MCNFSLNQSHLVFSFLYHLECYSSNMTLVEWIVFNVWSPFLFVIWVLYQKVEFYWFASLSHNKFLLVYMLLFPIKDQKNVRLFKLFVPSDMFKGKWSKWSKESKIKYTVHIICRKHNILVTLVSLFMEKLLNEFELWLAANEISCLLVYYFHFRWGGQIINVIAGIK